MSVDPEEKRFERKLRPYRGDQRRVRAQFGDLGFVLRGSIALRRLPCGKPKCGCRASGKGHGPYYQITWKEGGKTESRFLPPTLVPLYREWLSNGHGLDRIVDRLLALSRRAADAVRAEEAERLRVARRSQRSRGRD